MAKEALVSGLDLPIELKTPIGIHIGNVIKINRGAQKTIIESVKVFKKNDTVIVAVIPSISCELKELEPVYESEIKGYEHSGEGILFTTSFGSPYQDILGVRITQEPILDIQIPVQPLRAAANNGS